MPATKLEFKTLKKRPVWAWLRVYVTHCKLIIGIFLLKNHVFCFRGETWIMRIKATRNFFIVFCLLAVLFIDSRAWWKRRRRRRYSPPPCRPRDCSYSWSSWSWCSCDCGYSCTKTRKVSIHTEKNGCGSCPYKEGDSETENCNRNACKNAYYPKYEGCHCRPGWEGTCCQNG